MPDSPANTLFWVAVVLCVVAQVAITAAAARTPRAVSAEGEVPVPHRAAEVAWSLVPAVMLALVLLLTWNMIRLSGIDHHRPAQHAVPAAAGGDAPAHVH